MIRTKSIRRFTPIEGLKIESKRGCNYDPLYDPENSLITENWIPKQMEIVRKLRIQFKESVSNFKELYEWVDDDFVQSVKTSSGNYINNPVQFYVFHYLRTIHVKKQLASKFKKGLITWKDYRNSYEQTKGRMYVVRGLENLFRNIKTKQSERTNY